MLNYLPEVHYYKQLHFCNQLDSVTYASKHKEHFWESG